MIYKEALLYLESLNSFGIKLGLERIKKLADILGNPQRKYKTIHITGTNGKGSTTVMLTKVLTESGIKAGMYISPHLVSYTERMKIGDNDITEEDFAQAISVVAEAVLKMVEAGEENPTQFEVLTAAAFYYFAKQKVEYAVIEVGLGGLLDSTNIIIPEVSVITNIEMDHADRCGGTIKGIAENKAGIIKNEVPVVVGIDNNTIDIIRRTAKKETASLLEIDKDFNSFFIKLNGQEQIVMFKNSNIDFAYNLKLLGEHQIKNSAIVCQTALLLREKDSRIDINTIKNGLSKTLWPGRFEIMKEKPLIIIDGAHNLAGARMLSKSLKKYYPDKKRVFLLGILKDKDVEGIIDELVMQNDYVVVTEPDSDRAANAQYVAEKVKAEIVYSISDSSIALNKALSLMKEDSLLCVAGSLYLIGKIRKILQEDSLNI